jgi:hypothetical protein
MLTLAQTTRFGLTRAALYLNGLPQLYAEGLELDPGHGVLGTHQIARITSRVAGMIFLKLADGAEAILEAPNEVTHKLNEGLSVECLIKAEARGDKSARAGFIAIREGEAPARLNAPTSLLERLTARAAAIWPDAACKDADADEVPDMLARARYEALEPLLELPGGGRLSIEPTRALIACDIDTAGFAGVNVSAKAFARQCNDAATGEVARRLRLSGYAGLVVIDLIGNRQDFDRLRGLMLHGLAGEAGSVIIGPISRFGTFEMVKPWSVRPIIDQVRDERAVTMALRLVDEAFEAARNDAGAILTIRAPSEVIGLLQPRLSASYDPLSARLRLETSQGVAEVVR